MGHELEEWIELAYQILPLCTNPEEFIVRIREQEKKWLVKLKNGLERQMTQTRLLVLGSGCSTNTRASASVGAACVYGLGISGSVTTLSRS